MLSELSTPTFWLELLEIMGINILLSGDNAVVIALASRSLPPAHRRLAILGGSAGAVLLRVVFCLIIVWLLQVPFLKLIGGLLLLYVAVKLVRPDPAGDDRVTAKAHLWGAIQTIIVADAVMSLDNVVAIAAAAQGSVLLITLGLVFSVPLIVFGSQLVVGVLNRYPALVLGGGGLLGWIAGEIIVSDPFVYAHLPYSEHLLALVAKPALAVAVMASGMVLAEKAPLAQPVEVTSEDRP